MTQKNKMPDEILIHKPIRHNTYRGDNEVVILHGSWTTEKEEPHTEPYLRKDLCVRKSEVLDVLRKGYKVLQDNEFIDPCRS